MRQAHNPDEPGLEPTDLAAISDLETLLSSLHPTLSDVDYVFCSVDGQLRDWLQLDSLSTCRESEGLSLVIRKDRADQAGLVASGPFRLITLGVHSSLEAVGLTAAVAGSLASHNISANVIAACHHDHILIPSAQAEEALAILARFGSE